MTVSTWRCPVHKEVFESHINPCHLCKNKKHLPKADTPSEAGTINCAGGLILKCSNPSVYPSAPSSSPYEIKGKEKQQSLVPFI